MSDGIIEDCPDRLVCGRCNYERLKHGCLFYRKTIMPINDACIDCYRRFMCYTTSTGICVILDKKERAKLVEDILSGKKILLDKYPGM